MRSKYAELLVTTVANAHLWHFYTKSYSRHMALSTFYTCLDTLADSYIESDIGVHGAIEPTGDSFNYQGEDGAVPGILALKDATKAMRDLNEDANQNGLVATLESIMSLVDQTLYRLNNLS